MEFGLQHGSFVGNLGNDALFTTNCWEYVKEMAIRAENADFRSFWLMDHFLQIPTVGSRDEPFLECWTTLSALSAITNRIKLGPLVTCAHYRNPALLAKMSASLDVISKGRLYLGVGAGWFKEEAISYGYEFYEPAAHRIQAMAEAVKIIKSMWANQKTTFNGQYYKINDAICEPKPLQLPHPPVLIGGEGEKYTLKCVASMADACNLFGDYDHVDQKLRVLQHHCNTVNRDFDEIEKTKYDVVFMAQTEHELNKKLAFAEVTPGRKIHRDIWTLIGTPEQVTDNVRKWETSGIQHLIVSIGRNDPESFTLFTEQVMPNFLG